MPAKMPKRFTDPDAARAHLEALQWPEGPICPHCAEVNRASQIKGGRPGLWFCNACRKQFSVTVGTVFERSKVPLNTWLYANHLLCSSKKGISAHQIARMLGVTYKTAWFMSHRIREAMAPIAGSEPPLGGEGLVVEADEAYIGQKDGSARRQDAGGYANKRTVLSLVERGGNIRSFKLGGPTRKPKSALRSAPIWTRPASCTRTARRSTRHGRDRQHEAVDHNKTFVRKSKFANSATSIGRTSTPTRWKASSRSSSAAWSAPTSIEASSICSAIWPNSISA